MTSVTPITLWVEFEEWFDMVEPPLRRALCASYGFEAGREATAEAMAWAWEHRDRLNAIERPVPYLFRVAQSKRRRRRVPLIHTRTHWEEPWVEPRLAGGLARLTSRQRVTVVLIHGYGWTHAEVADLLDVSLSTVQTHLERGLATLRSVLEVSPHA